MKSKSCSVCGAAFTCGSADGDQHCWCAEIPQIMPLDFTQDCRCPTCLKAAVKQKIDEYVRTVPADRAVVELAGTVSATASPVEDIDFYVNGDGNYVFTAWYHLKRGSCCQNGCLHCPYGFAEP